MNCVGNEITVAQSYPSFWLLSGQFSGARIAQHGVRVRLPGQPFCILSRTDPRFQDLLRRVGLAN